MDIRSYFSSVNKATGKPEKRKIEEPINSETVSSSVSKKNKTTVSVQAAEGGEQRKKVAKKVEQKDLKMPKRSLVKTMKNQLADSDDEVPIKKKRQSERKKMERTKTVEISSDEEEPIMMSRKKKVIEFDSDYEVEVMTKKAKSSSKTLESKNDSVVESKKKPKEVDVSPQSKENSKGQKQSPVKESPRKIKPIKPESTFSPVKIKKSNKMASPAKISPLKAKTANNFKSSSTLSVSTERSVRPQLPKSEMWVDKYKPTTINNVIGQHGDRSCAKKLLKWLENWSKNKDSKAAFGKYGSGVDDGSGFKAALLSGPPGIGKTTTAHLAAKECGYELVELNASDTRNKKSMDEHVRTLLTNRALSTNFAQSHHSTTAKHLLVMDEVDGMGGNADRGGIAELIQLIKQTKIPIICICNDRNSPKIRSLGNYCFDLRFTRPRTEQIKGAMMSICYKEDVKIDPQTLEQVIESSNHDVRQVLHYLSLYTSKGKKVEQMNSSEPIKDVKLGPFDAVKKVFSSGPKHSSITFNDRSDLFFSDYSLIPLFVWENYLRVTPIKAKTDSERLKAATRTITAMSFGDLIETEIRQRQSWNLLPLQAAFSTVLPGYYMGGYFSGMINFPSLLGKISNFNKRGRLLAELKQHMNLKISGSKSCLNLDYLVPLRDRLLKPLLNKESDAIEQTIKSLQEYCLRKDDIESIIELTIWGSEKNPFTQIDSKIKSALTRTYNKTSEFLPYATENMFKKAKAKGKAIKNKRADDSDEEEEEQEEEELDDEEMYVPDDY